MKKFTIIYREICRTQKRKIIIWANCPDKAVEALEFKFESSKRGIEVIGMIEG